MKTLSNHTILYDDDCSACASYTQVFVATKMIEAIGRQPFSKAINNHKEIDVLRANNEIAMVNHETGDVTYGIDSLFKIFEHNFPLLKVVFRIKIFRFLMSKLYFFISYNRKVIVPGDNFESCNTCAPTLNYTYRWAYIGFAWVVTSLVLTSYAQLLTPIISETNLYREFIICGGQIVFQALIVGVVYPQRLIHYLGNMMTVSLGGAVLLIPALLLQVVTVSNLFFVGYFLVVVALMFFEHVRRVKIIELPWFISLSWVIYRVIVLYIIY